MHRYGFIMPEQIWTDRELSTFQPTQLKHPQKHNNNSNPELRNLFFRSCTLLRLSILPVFVFDGPNRPKSKRNKIVLGRDHPLEKRFKKMAEIFGFEIRKAPGEAEAELAEMNARGEIDLVFTEDVDTMIFGCTHLFRHFNKSLSPTPSSSQPAASRPKLYTRSSLASLSLTPLRLAFLALLSGGDYDTAGCPGMGPKTAIALARCGFAETLEEGVKREGGGGDWVTEWREAVKNELRTNSRGMLGKKMKVVADKIGDGFPDLKVFGLYREPETSYRTRDSRFLGQGVPKWRKDLDVEGVIGFVLETLEDWNEIRILTFFRKSFWKGLVMWKIREMVLSGGTLPGLGDSDDEEESDEIEHENMQTPKKKAKKKVMEEESNEDKLLYFYSKVPSYSPDLRILELDPQFLRIKKSRTHASTGETLEYMTELDPSSWSKILGSIIREGGPRITETNQEDSQVELDEDGNPIKKRRQVFEDPLEPLSEYFPAEYVELVAPKLVERFEGGEKMKRKEKKEKERRKKEREEAKTGDGRKKIERTKDLVASENEEIQEALEKTAKKTKSKKADSVVNDSSRLFEIGKSKKAKDVKTKTASELDFINLSDEANSSSEDENGIALPRVSKFKKSSSASLFSQLSTSRPQRSTAFASSTNLPDSISSSKRPSKHPQSKTASSDSLPIDLTSKLQNSPKKSTVQTSPRKITKSTVVKKTVYVEISDSDEDVSKPSLLAGTKDPFLGDEITPSKILAKELEGMDLLSGNKKPEVSKESEMFLPSRTTFQNQKLKNMIVEATRKPKSKPEPRFKSSKVAQVIDLDSD